MVTRLKHLSPSLIPALVTNQYERTNMSERRLQPTTCALGQLCSSDRIADNMAAASLLAADTSRAGAQLLVLPENAACFGQGLQQQTAERFDELSQAFAALAAQHGIWLAAGSLPCPYRPDTSVIADGRVRSACMLYDPSGTAVARYDKIHLFDAQVGDNIGNYQESATFEAGDAPVVAKTPFGNIGMMICYDLRFAELAITLRKMGADILTAPSAFTHATGKAHWQALMVARALDSQCLVLGAAQAGTHGDRATYGHSLAVDAWGQLLTQADGSSQGIYLAPFNQQAQEKVRQQITLFNHRKLTLSV